MSTTKRKATKKSSARKSKAPAKKAPARRSARSALAVAKNASYSVDERVSAMSEATMPVGENDESLQAILKVLRDKNEPSEVRLAAFQSLGAAAFSLLAFESARGEYLAALREVSTDPDPVLRRRALGALAREQDGFAQKKLLEGLQDPEKALVTPEKALQFLSYDIHADAYQVAREVVAKPPNTASKIEALRLLASDATAAPIFEKILRDKDESSDVRQVCAAALQSLSPDKLQSYAREALLDPSQPDEIQATSLTAITQFGDREAVSKDTKLRKHVDKLSGKGSTRMKQGARRFIKKYGDE